MPVVKSNSRKASFVPDERQRQAIEHVHGPLLVVAGAGTGKTSVLTHRIAHLVREGHAQPQEILALTYTVNAAREMRGRLRSLLEGREVHAATFHDYCLDLLKTVHKDFGVLDESDLWIYLRRRIRDLHLEHFVSAPNLGKFLHDLLEFMDRCHDELVTPEKYARYVERLECGEAPLPRVAKSKNELPREEVLGRCREIARVFATVERWLEEENLGTFSHMIVRAHALLASDERALAEARSRARFILADEFQDANLAQVKILGRLAGANGNIFAVGDPDQAIYRFRGASSAAFQLFQHQFPKARLVALGKNRRSTTPILRSAFALINENPPVFAQHGGAPAYRRAPLQSVREEEAAETGAPMNSQPVEVCVLADKYSEGPEVVGRIRDLQKKLKCKWSDFGILYRSHWHRDDVVEELADAGIPYVIESMDVSNTPQARDLLACLHAVVSSGDDVSLFRVAALPRFRVNPEELRQAMRANAKKSREGPIVPLSSVLDRIEGGADVLRAIQSAKAEIQRKEAKGRTALEIIVQHFGLDRTSPMTRAVLKFAETWETKAINKTTALEELVDYLAYFREAGGVIPLIARDETKDSENAVRLMTVHGAKGLEFRHVIILRANSNSFPSSYKETLVAFPGELRDVDSISGNDDQILHKEEERRLFYVAMTRACDSLQIFAKEGTGKIDKTPPGYMRELMANPSLAPWFKPVPARGSQKSLEIAAGASGEYPAESHLNHWLELPVLDGLQAQLSASAVDSYERCGLQFKLQRDWRLAEKPAAAMQFGAAMHRVLKTYFDSARAGRPKTDEELLDQFRSDLALAGIHEKYQHELYEEQGIAQLSDFLAKMRSQPMPNVLHTEQTFQVRVGTTMVTGRMDRIDKRDDDTVAIVDYKTGKAKDQDVADESLQLSLYAMAAREAWGYKVGALILYNLEDNIPVVTTRSEADLLAARVRVEAAAQGIADGIFDAKSGMHCAFCAYRSLCPEKEKRIAVTVEAVKE